MNRDAPSPFCAVVRNTDWRFYMYWAQITSATTFFYNMIFLQKELIARIINTFSRFWDISKIENKIFFFNARLKQFIIPHIGWGKHHQTQSCSNLSPHCRCLPVAASVHSFNSYSSYNGSPCDIDNWISRSVNGMTTLQKKTQAIPHFFYTINRLKWNWKLHI